MENRKIRPLGDRVLVERIKPKEKTEGGLFIPDVAQEKATEARVIAVGPGRVLDDGRVIEPRVWAGDKIVFAKYAGAETAVLGDEYVVLREDDILAVLE